MKEVTGEIGRRTQGKVLVEKWEPGCRGLKKTRMEIGQRIILWSLRKTLCKEEEASVGIICEGKDFHRIDLDSL